MATKTEKKSISERGMHLEAAHERQQNSNIHAGKMVVVGEIKNENGETEKIMTEIGSRCRLCGNRVRGLNHINGAYHKGNVPKHSR
jgi:hypothetical protein